jgi:RHS repeat-associated protein
VDADFGFTGHYHHQPSGLHLVLYRVYDADLGRWISRDPIGEAGGINIYAYVGDNPVTWIDPLGLEADIYVIRTSRDSPTVVNVFENATTLGICRKPIDGG